MGGALATLVQEIGAANPERLGHVDASRILFVVGAARKEARASIRPLTYGGNPPCAASADGRWTKPRIVVGGVRMLYEICLRPRFFTIDAREQLRVLVHELWHIAPAFDGTLAGDRRHGGADDAAFAGAVDEMVAACSAESESATVLATAPETRMTAWLSRPPSRVPALGLHRDTYDEADLYCAVVIRPTSDLRHRRRSA